MLVEAGAGRLQAEPGHPGPSAGGREQPLAAQLMAVVQDQDVVVAVAPRGGRRHAEKQLDTVPAQFLAECLAQRRGLAGQHVPRSLGQGHLAAQAAHGLGHLGADRPAAEDEQAAGDRLHRGHLTAGPDVVQLAQAGDGRHDRVGAGRQHDVRRGVARVADLDDAWTGQPAGAADQVDALARQPGLLPGVGVVRDHEVAVGQRRLDVNLRGARRLACAVGRLAGAQQGLGRDAGPVRALASGQLPLDYRHPQAAVGQLARAVLARRAGPHDDDVVVVGAHEPAACPADSSAMYRAYQSGQSGSGRPVSSSYLA